MWPTPRNIIRTRRIAQHCQVQENVSFCLQWYVEVFQFLFLLSADGCARVLRHNERSSPRHSAWRDESPLSMLRNVRRSGWFSNVRISLECSRPQQDLFSTLIIFVTFRSVYQRTIAFAHFHTCFFGTYTLGQTQSANTHKHTVCNLLIL